MSEHAPYDSRADTWEHIHQVRLLLHEAIENLLERAAGHDLSKLREPELSAFNIATPKLAGLTYGSEEYKQSLRELGPALEHHYAENPHHPQYHDNGVAGMSIFDLLEMLVDWKAASTRTKDPGNFAGSIDFNQHRFGFGDELRDVLVNTARELGLIDSTDEDPQEAPRSVRHVRRLRG